MAPKRKVSTTVDTTPTSPPKRVTRSSTRAAIVSPVAAPLKANRKSTRVQTAKTKLPIAVNQTVAKKPNKMPVKTKKVRKSAPVSASFGGFSNSATSASPFGPQTTTIFGTPSVGFGAAPVSTGFGFGTAPTSSGFGFGAAPAA
ncbi:hypothetical protein As57867_007249, partial [Aphanomyces stellatus]